MKPTQDDVERAEAAIGLLGVPALPWALAIIAQAIADARERALEQAAALLENDNTSCSWPTPARHVENNRRIAAALRALKGAE